MSTTLTNLWIHVIFSTKERKPFIADQFRERLYVNIGGIIRKEGAEPLSIGGTADHIHFTMKIQSNRAIADLVRTIKANSSKWINENHLVTDKFAWQDGYGGFSVSASQIEKVRHYIENQARHHKKKSFKDELTEISAKHGVAFDPRYLSD